MDQATLDLLSRWIKDEPEDTEAEDRTGGRSSEVRVNTAVVLQNWDRTAKKLAQNGLDPDCLINLVRQSEGGNPKQLSSFGQHLMGELMKAAMVVSRLGNPSIEPDAWYELSLRSIVGDLVNASKYALEVPAHERSFYGCVMYKQGINIRAKEGNSVSRVSREKGR